jgi:hypothetical protein
MRKALNFATGLFVCTSRLYVMLDAAVHSRNESKRVESPCPIMGNMLATCYLFARLLCWSISLSTLVNSKFIIEARYSIPLSIYSYIRERRLFV